ncbi:hypothetical protein I4I73_12415 [Pseudonocardia sp. KRD-184]|uniref:Fe/B12 periplasmic-binding domain-containing protein n=1 Tax=Pseudonocardia oceani TaxID=2792013 RepID=A0ABS6U1K1_9PSEU|nr:hypothetical protein [Pseudonocardia oceani]MBW0089724.1 hypothetical protein [Pseudonocardia oceani]MBW0096791.1 hypothetical protein [Pseudonocardia oceani]MBW0109448.1 hypothetical protein [Pseudonocardia oceani]MBW0120836.1 hypothetical protein [Pseudonocardia oceani]MBW0126107.1 hypothetical protein [Pseudonocardia oceani]
MSYANPDLRAALEASPLFTSLPVVRDERVVTVDIATSTALAVPSILRVGYVLDELVPLIESRIGT